MFLGEGTYTDSNAFRNGALGPGTAINYYNSNAGGQLGFAPLADGRVIGARLAQASIVEP